VDNSIDESHLFALIPLLRLLKPEQMLHLKNIRSDNEEIAENAQHALAEVRKKERKKERESK
jgi:hypothetical protein